MRTFLALGLIALIAFGVWERSAIATLREENLPRREEQAAAASLSNEIAALTRTLTASVETAPDFDRSELLRLRNAVRRLRSTQTDPELLRAENERLAASLKTGSVRLPRLADQPGYIARAAWANVGNATPEAALQTILHAMRDADLDLLLTLLGGPESDSMRRHLQEDPVNVRSDFAQKTQTEFTSTGFLVTGREEHPDGKVILKVKFGARSEPIEMEFQHAGGVWKMIKGF